MVTSADYKTGSFGEFNIEATVAEKNEKDVHYHDRSISKKGKQFTWKVYFLKRMSV